MSLDAITDTNGTAQLADLRRLARAGEPGAAREVAQQFEALFVQMMIKQMREAMPTEGGLFGGEGMKLYESLHDQQLSLALAKRGGLGLADSIERQLTGAAPSAGEERPLQFPLHRLPARREALVPMLERGASGAAVAAGQAANDAPARVARGAPLRSAPPPADPAEFVRRMLPHARRAAARLGVAPEVLVAQSALETGWGRHVMRDAEGRSSHNMFGIKATGGWQGKQVRVSTLEYRDGIAQRELAAFRGYPDPGASFADYARLVGEHPRYREALANADSPEGYLRALQDAGYATDPAYADKILSILERGLPGLAAPVSSDGALNSAAPRPITPQTGDPGIARVRPPAAGEETS